MTPIEIDAHKGNQAPRPNEDLLEKRSSDLAAAVLDRLAAPSIRIDIDGPSYRQFLARKRAQEHGQQPPAEQEALEA